MVYMYMTMIILIHTMENINFKLEKKMFRWITRLIEMAKKLNSFLTLSSFNPSNKKNDIWNLSLMFFWPHLFCKFILIKSIFFLFQIKTVFTCKIILFSLYSIVVNIAPEICNFSCATGKKSLLRKMIYTV